MTAKAMCRWMDTRWFLMSASLFIATACSGAAEERLSVPTAGSTPSSIEEPDPTRLVDRRGGPDDRRRGLGRGRLSEL